jgi:L-2-hydroxyglutarate oxidase
VTRDSQLDVVIVGGGIVGLATANSLLSSNPNLKLIVLEKESSLGAHQTGHNSGVIHSGLYYKPGSLKAKNCIEGYTKLLQFCREHDIAHEICGKIVVALSEQERSQLEMLRQRGEQNGLTGIRRLSKTEIVEIEPHCSGIDGLFVPQTGIVDYGAMTMRLAERIQNFGGQILTNNEVIEITESSNSVRVCTARQQFTTRTLITCGGLHSDRLAMQTQPDLDLRIIPFRGEYFELKESAPICIRELPISRADNPFGSDVAPEDDTTGKI